MIPSIQYRGNLQDEASLTAALEAGGLQPDWAAAKARWFCRSAACVRERITSAADAPLTAFFVPGRIEILGKHTDYAGGSSLLAAAEQGLAIVAAPREDRSIRITDVRRGERIDFPFDGQVAPSAGHWSNYPMTVARRLARNFPAAGQGAEIAFGSDLPPAAGMSSSSAMIVAFFLVLAELNRVWDMPEFKPNVPDRVQLAAYLATVENGETFVSLPGDRGVGTAGGSEDHTAILCCQPGILSQFAYCPVRHISDVALPDGYALAIGASGMAAEKTGTAMDRYNRASRLAAKIAEIWRAETGRDDPHLAGALASAPDAHHRVRQVLQTVALSDAAFSREELLARFEHFRIENQELLPAAVEAIARADMGAFGDLVSRSQQCAEDLLGNQVAQTRYLAAAARRCGAVAASAFGAGFGGSVWALVEKSRLAQFLHEWPEGYAAQAYPHSELATFSAMQAGPSAFRVV